LINPDPSGFISATSPEMAKCEVIAFKSVMKMVIK